MFLQMYISNINKKMGVSIGAINNANIYFRFMSCMKYTPAVSSTWDERVSLQQSCIILKGKDSSVRNM